MEAIPVKIYPRGFGETRRRDWWWIEPMLVFIVFSGFLAYGTWAALQNEYFEYGPYLSPFYSPLLFGTSHHSWFGPIATPAIWPPFLAFSPALFILPFPGLFRFTCYYYRGAYYKAFWADPISCTVGEPRGTSYWGERWLPLVLQNAHRYAAYIAVIFVGLLSYDVWLALWWPAADGGTEFGVGVGTLVMLVNVLLLVVGCLMDSNSAILVLAPLLAPAAAAYGFDKVLFGIIMVLNLEIGFLTPPVGLNLIVAMSAFKQPFGLLCRAAAPFILLMMGSLAIVIWQPWIAMWAVTGKF